MSNNTEYVFLHNMSIILQNVVCTCVYYPMHISSIHNSKQAFLLINFMMACNAETNTA